MEKIIEIKGKNIYPFSRENFDAIVNYYYVMNGVTNIGSGSMEECFQKASQVELYEFEYISDLISTNFNFFKEKIGDSGLTIINLCSFGLDAYLDNFKSGSFRRNIVTKSFQELMVKSIK